MSIHRVFVDTNVLLSGLFFDGNEAKLLRLSAAKRIRIVLADVVIDEAREVIARKFPGLIGRLDNLLDEVFWESASVPDVQTVELAAILVRDPNDVPILASMIVSEPDYAVTGDKDLLTDEIKKHAPTCRCVEYLEEYKKTQ